MGTRKSSRDRLATLTKISTRESTTYLYMRDLKNDCERPQQKTMRETLRRENKRRENKKKERENWCYCFFNRKIKNSERKGNSSLQFAVCNQTVW